MRSAAVFANRAIGVEEIPLLARRWRGGRDDLGDRRSRQCFAGAGVLVLRSRPLDEAAPAQANTDVIGGRRRV
jgi:hypothetical protein